MKRTLSLCVGAIASAALCNVSAYTVDDLMANGGWAVRTVQSQDAINSQYWHSGGCRFERVDGDPNKIRLTGFFEDDGPSWVFTVTGNKLSLAYDASSDSNPEYTIRAMKHYGYKDYGYLSSAWEGTITTDSSTGDLLIEFPYFGFLKNGEIKFSYGGLDPVQHIYDSYRLRIYTPNLFITDDVYDNNGRSLQKKRFYRGRLTLNSDGQTILNFSNDGYAITSGNELQEVDLLYFSDGDFGIRRQAAVRGPLFADQQSTKFMKWLNYNYVGWNNGEVYNEFYATPVDYVDHIQGHNHWAHHVNGGSLATVAATVLPFDNFTTFWNGYINGNYQELNNFVVKNTKIYWADDVTPLVEIKDVQYGADAVNGIYVSGTIVPTMQNLDVVDMPQYIDHYELHIVPGVHNSVKDKATNSSTGLSNGISIHSSEFDTDRDTDAGQRAAAQSATDRIRFNKLIPPSRLPAGFSINNGHTLYVKTVYTADSELTPSYHALTPLSRVTTGVEDVIGDASPISVTAGPGTISVSGATKPVSIYSVAGINVYTGSDATVNVTPGVYIVTSGNYTTKVAVK